jgi:uncharacterized protein YutE (UPF0331/DUF86 family)
MVDAPRLRDLLDRLQAEVAGLADLAQQPAAALLADPVALDAVKYRFVVSIEVCIDIAQHIIASERLRAPETFADAFGILAEAELIPTEIADAAQRMARFRNLLVHVYADVDDSRVVEILQTQLDDFSKFRQSVAALVAD